MYNTYILSVNHVSYGFSAKSGGETATVLKYSNQIMPQVMEIFLTSAKHSAMISRSPKKVSWISSQERKIYTENSLNKKLTRNGHQKVQIAGR